MIWLIGNQGMLGREVERQLALGGAVFLGTDRELNIADRETLETFAAGKGPFSTIINCAAYTDVDRAEEEPEAAFAANATGACNLARIARNQDSVLVHLSTDYVFDGEKRGGYTEEDAPRPLGVYGKSKLRGERWVRDMAPKHFIIRTAWLYGAGGRNFVTTMLRLFSREESVDVVADQWGSPTYARDLAAALLCLIRKSGITVESGSEIECGAGVGSESAGKPSHGEATGPPYGTYHFTNRGSTSWYDFARRIARTARQMGLPTGDVTVTPIKSRDYPARAERPRFSHLRTDKIRRAAGMTIRRWPGALRSFLQEVKTS